MKYIMKLNVISNLYAIRVFVPIELMLNVDRISRLTKWEIGTVITFTVITLIVKIMGGTILLVLLTKRWLGERKANFFTVILWVPYFVLFINAFASLFPITYRGDVPNPVIGLVIIGGLITYPFYILSLNFFGMTSGDKTAKTA